MSHQESQYEKLGRVECGTRFSGVQCRRVPRMRQQIRCHCGEVVTCIGGTNSCECGREYSMSGNLLAPRSQWGAETGEHPADVARWTSG